jgi:hypothetical protein
MGTPQAKVPANVTEQAVEVVEDGMSLRTVAARQGTYSNTLKYHVNVGAEQKDNSSSPELVTIMS